MELTELADGSCRVDEQVFLSTDADISGALTIEVEVMNLGSGPYGIPGDETTFSGSVSVYAE